MATGMPLRPRLLGGLAVSGGAPLALADWLLDRVVGAVELCELHRQRVRLRIRHLARLRCALLPPKPKRTPLSRENIPTLTASDWSATWLACAALCSPPTPLSL
eukprot:34596-Prorocentrum_minimum.AAC.8